MAETVALLSSTLCLALLGSTAFFAVRWHRTSAALGDALETIARLRSFRRGDVDGDLLGARARFEGDCG